MVNKVIDFPHGEIGPIRKARRPMGIGGHLCYLMKQSVSWKPTYIEKFSLSSFVKSGVS
jgi:hypothetical protein